MRAFTRLLPRVATLAVAATAIALPVLPTIEAAEQKQVPTVGVRRLLTSSFISICLGL